MFDKDNIKLFRIRNKDAFNNNTRKNTIHDFTIKTLNKNKNTNLNTKSITKSTQKR